MELGSKSGRLRLSIQTVSRCNVDRTAYNREYKRRWRKKNPDKERAMQERYESTHVRVCIGGLRWCYPLNGWDKETFLAMAAERKAEQAEEYAAFAETLGKA